MITCVNSLGYCKFVKIEGRCTYWGGGEDDMVYKRSILYCRAVEAGGWRGCSWAAPGCRSRIGIN